MDHLLEKFSATQDIMVAWGDMDAYQHLNNVKYFRYLETARIKFFDELEGEWLDPTPKLGPILAWIDCRFRKQVYYPDTITVGTRVARMAEDRLLLYHQMISHQQQEIVAEANAIVVSFDFINQQKCPIPPQIWAAVVERDAPPVGPILRPQP